MPLNNVLDICQLIRILFKATLKFQFFITLETESAFATSPPAQCCSVLTSIALAVLLSREYMRTTMLIAER